MRRSDLLSFSVAVLAFVGMDLLLHWSAVWFGRENFTVASLVAGQFLLPFAPVVVAGLVAGYIGTPRGFVLGLVAGFVGSSVSVLWRFQGVSLAVPGAAAVWWSIACWVCGVALATAVYGWAGERVHFKLRG